MNKGVFTRATSVPARRRQVAGQNTRSSDVTVPSWIPTMNLATSRTLLVFIFGTTVARVNALIRLLQQWSRRKEVLQPLAGRTTCRPQLSSPIHPQVTRLKASTKTQWPWQSPATVWPVWKQSKALGRKRLWPNLTYYSSTRLEALRKTMGTPRSGHPACKFLHELKLIRVKRVGWESLMHTGTGTCVYRTM
jgi:hypothetical protein